jgi:carbamoyltransferase
MAKNLLPWPINLHGQANKMTNFVTTSLAGASHGRAKTFAPVDVRLVEPGVHQAKSPSQEAAQAPCHVVVGVSGVRRNAAAALAIDGRLHAFCEQERLTRVRGVGIPAGQIPTEAVDAVLRMAPGHPGVSAYVTAEDGIEPPDGFPHSKIEHHFGHAATAFLTSPFHHAAILVCDSHSTPSLSVWAGLEGTISPVPWPCGDRGFASLLTRCAAIFGFAPGQEHRFEALARLGDGREAESLASLLGYRDGTLWVSPDFEVRIADRLGDQGQDWSVSHAASMAAGLQYAIGAVLVKIVSDIRTALGIPRLCLGGGLFFNTFFTTLIAQSGWFEDVFVPPNPGNSGLAAGAALTATPRSTDPRSLEASPFLGPGYDLEQIKGTLDNCKLSSECLSEGEVIDAVVQALTAGRLVGWFQGRMEWGPRALGHRSILANPLSPYALDNLNVFLKQRDRQQAFGLSICSEDLGQHFIGPERSPWMQFDYRVKDPDLFRYVLPYRASTLRVQSVEPGSRLLYTLLSAFRSASGIGALVNTSFNGFSEPIVCSPRDAIRVFYGTALDVLVMGRFVLWK